MSTTQNIRREVIVLLLLGLGLALYLSHPALFSGGNRLVGREYSEQYVGAWATQIVHENLLEDHRLPIYVDRVGFKDSGVVYPMSLPTALISMPFYPLWGGVAVYNAAMALNFLLAFFGAYLLLRHLAGGRAWAALPGALLYALSPFALESFTYGPVECTALGWIPLCLLCIERHDGSRWWHVLSCGAALAVTFSANPYFGGFTLGAAIYLMLTQPGAGLRPKLRRTLLTTAAAVLLIAPQAWGIQATIQHQRSLLPRRVAPRDMTFHKEFLTRHQAVDLASLALPTRKFHSAYQHTGFYLGLSALLLCGVALARARRSRRWLWLGLVFLLFSVGAGLRVGGWQAGGEADPLRLPPFWLLMHVPGFTSIFYPYRALPLVLLCMGAMITLLLARRWRGLTWVPLALGALVVADMLQYRDAEALPAAPYGAPAFYHELSKAPDRMGVMDLPPPGNDNEKGRYLLYQLVHRKQIPYNLDMDAFWPESDAALGFFWHDLFLSEQTPNEERNWADEARKFSCTRLNCKGVGKAWRAGYRLLVLHHTHHPGLDRKLAACLDACPITKLHVDDEVTVYGSGGMTDAKQPTP